MKIVYMLVLLCGCLPREQRCATDADCGPNGVCEGVGFCSFTDSSCTSGRRFGDLSGSYSQSCVGDQSMPDGGNRDTDGDGVLDASDNCPAVANANQFNEDSDKFGDVCDPCPPVAGDSPPDTDGDGVADACDPNPAVAGHSIALFEGFHAGVPTGWEVTGTWTMTGDDIEGAATNAIVLATPLTTTTHETVSTSLTVMSIAGSNNFSGVVTNRQAGSTSGVACSLYRTNQFTPTPGLLASEGNTFMPAAYAQAMTSGATFSVKLRRDATMYSCDAVTGTNAAMTTVTTNLNNTPSSVGIYVLGATVRFSWLMVVSNP